MNQDLLVFFQEIICLKKIKDGAYVINLDEYADVGEIVYFDSLCVEHIPEEIKKFTDRRSLNFSTSYRPWYSALQNKNIIAKIFRVQANNSVMCGYFCIGFIDFMLAGKKLTDYTSLFSPHGFKQNDCIILSYFKKE